MRRLSLSEDSTFCTAYGGFTSENINTVLRDGCYPLLKAVSFNNVTMVQFMLNLGANPNMGRVHPLYYAVKYRRYESMCALLEAPNIMVDFKTIDGRTSLYKAIQKGEPDVIMKLIDYGARIEKLPKGYIIKKWIKKYQKGRDACRNTSILLMGLHKYVLPRKMGGLDTNIFKTVGKHVWSNRKEWGDVFMINK